MDRERLLQRTSIWAWASSCALHAALAALFLTLTLAVPKRPLQHLIVHTVKLSPKNSILPVASVPAVAAPAAAPAATPKILPEETPKEVQPDKKEEVQESKEVVEEKRQEPVQESTKETPPEKKIVEEAVQEESPKKKEGQKVVANSSVSKKATPRKASQKSSSKSTKPTASSKRTKNAQPSYNKKLVAEALNSLNKSRSSSENSGTVSSGKGVALAQVGSVGHLHSEEGIVSGVPSQGTEESSVAGTPEGFYISDLVRRLQLHVRLVEPGEVRVKLTLTRKGSVTDVTIVSCRSAAVKKSIGAALRAVPFSAFGNCFRGEESHSFSLRLSNDLVWTCA